MNLTRGSRRISGFTLIELIMTMVIVGIASVPLALLIRQHIEAGQACSNASVAMNLARMEMEVVNTMVVSAVVSVDTPMYRGYPYDVARTVSYVYGSDASLEGVKRVRVEVFAAGKKSPAASLVTYVARNVAYGQ